MKKARWTFYQHSCSGNFSGRVKHFTFSTVLNGSDLIHQAWLLVTKTSKLAPTFNPDLLVLCFSKSAAAKQRMLNGFVPDVKMNRTYMQCI